jgi:rubrerythrin
MKQMPIKRVRTHLAPTGRSKQPGAMKSNLSEQAKGSNLRGNIRGNIQHSIEKYMILAREAMMSGDRVLAESFYQQAEHYLRLNNEYKENIVGLSKNQPAPSAQERMIVSNNFEISIEQELSIAQSRL